MTDVRDTPYYTVAQAAKRLHVSPSTVWRWIAAQKLPSYRVGEKSIRIKKDDLETIIHPMQDEVRPMKPVRHQALPHDQRDIWATYDPDRARAALKASAGALRGIDIEQLKADLAAQRQQDSPGRPG